MDRLWAPWRSKYISSLGRKTKGCTFCAIYRQRSDRENYIFARNKHAFAVLNIYPYNNGHCLVVSRRHVNEISKLKRAEKLDLIELLEETKKILDKTLKPIGYNIGINLGRIAGAGFPGHLHIHIVPRWSGDVNFMPVVGEAKVLSQSLDALFQKIEKCAHVKKSKR